MPTRQELLEASERLHAHLLRRHYGTGLLHGPDPGVRFNLRLWRFLKAGLEFVPWRDDYFFSQAQGYWALSNWMLYEATGKQAYRDIAIESADATLARETPQGYWAYPLPERRHLIATLESIWGASPLLATYSREPRPELLDGAVRAYDFIVSQIGFQKHAQGEAVNYFDRPRGKVPNNSVIAAWFFLRLQAATGDPRFLEHVGPLFDFIASVQLPGGEIPYIVESPLERARPHYLCFQYNAYQFLHLVWSEQLWPGAGARPIFTRLAAFLLRGVQPSGACANNCASAGRGGPEVNYYTAALGAALYEAARLKLADCKPLSDRCYARVLARQQPDGSLGFSSRDYGFLRDSRSYPRQQAMALFHLLSGCGLGDGFRR
ncbi:MAG: hypothetical protein ACRD3O_09045 [Terriglobia bacterium]